MRPPVRHRKFELFRPTYLQSRGTVGAFATAYVAREAVGVLQARDAQMDERAPKAP